MNAEGFGGKEADGHEADKDQASDGHRPADLEEAPKRQWNIDQEAHVAEMESGEILHHCANAVDSGGRKVIWENKHFV